MTDTVRHFEEDILRSKHPKAADGDSGSGSTIAVEITHDDDTQLPADGIEHQRDGIIQTTH